MAYDPLLMWMNANPVFAKFIILILSFAIIIKASDLAVYGITRYARKFGISDYLIGFLVLSVASSLPEMTAAFIGSADSEPGVVFGTILGCGIFTTTIVLGVLALVGKKITLEEELISKSRYLFIAFVALPFILLLDGKISRLDGATLLCVFFAYATYLWRKEGSLGQLKHARIVHVWRDAFVFLGSLVAILLSTRWLVFSSIGISSSFNISPFLISLFVIAFGSSLPDLTVQVRSVLKGYTNLGLGEILGAVLIEILFIIGLIGVIYEIPLGNLALSKVMVSGLFYLISISFIVWVMRKREINWKHGLFLVCLYGIFVLTQLLMELL